MASRVNWLFFLASLLVPRHSGLACCPHSTVAVWCRGPAIGYGNLWGARGQPGLVFVVVFGGTYRGDGRRGPPSCQQNHQLQVRKKKQQLASIDHFKASRILRLHLFAAASSRTNQVNGRRWRLPLAVGGLARHCCRFERDGGFWRGSAKRRPAKTLCRMFSPSRRGFARKLADAGDWVLFLQRRRKNDALVREVLGAGGGKGKFDSGLPFRTRGVTRGRERRAQQPAFFFSSTTRAEWRGVLEKKDAKEEDREV